MTTTITGDQTVAITLSPASLDVTVVGTANAAGSFTTYVFHAPIFEGQFSFAGAIYAPKGEAYSIQNNSVIETAGTQAGTVFSTGILLGSPGVVNNFGVIAGEVGVSVLGPAGGYIHNVNAIDATNFGILMFGQGRVVNTGSITGASGTAIEMIGGGYVYNTGVINGGVVVEDFRYVNAGGINNSGTVFGQLSGLDGVLINTGSVISNSDGIRSNGSGNVFNYRFVSASSTGIGVTSYGYNSGTVIANGNGVAVNGTAGARYFFNSGRVTAGGSGVAFGTYGTLVNRGTIYGSSMGVSMLDSGYAANYGTITGRTGIYIGGSLLNYVYNSGTVMAISPAAGRENGIGVVIGYFNLTASGTLYNTGLVSGTNAGVEIYGAGYVYNKGQIIATNNTGSGIALLSGSVVNAGDVSGQAAGITLSLGSYVYNTGSVTGASGIEIGGSVASYVYNAGLITATGTSGSGISLAASGTVTNAGLISAKCGTGVVLAGGGVLYNYGTIKGGAVGGYIGAGGTVLEVGTITGTTFALDFAASDKNRLILAPDAVLSGTVDGGGGALELLASAGTIGGNVTDFTTATIDAGAYWRLADDMSLTKAVDNGTLAALSGDQLNIATLSGNGTIILAGGAVTLAGPVGSGEKIAFGGADETLALGLGPHFAATLINFASTDVIQLDGVTLDAVTGLSFAQGTLSLMENGVAMTIAFAHPSSFTGSTFVTFADGGDTGISLVSDARMSFLSPLATSQQAALPVYQLPYLATPKIAPAMATASQRGWLSHELIATIQMGAGTVTLHA